jgi:hypothetical protein
MPDSGTHLEGGWGNPIDQKETRSSRMTTWL